MGRHWRSDARFVSLNFGPLPAEVISAKENRSKGILCMQERFGTAATEEREANGSSRQHSKGGALYPTKVIDTCQMYDSLVIKEEKATTATTQAVRALTGTWERTGADDQLLCHSTAREAAAEDLFFSKMDIWDVMPKKN